MAVRTALGALSAPDRMVIRLHCLYEMSIDDVALILVKRPRAVQKSLERALAHLRNGPYGPELAALWLPAKRRHPT